MSVSGSGAKKTKENGSINNLTNLLLKTGIKNIILDYENLCWKYSKFLLAKSQRTWIRLRVNTFGDSQSPKNWTYTSPNKFDYLPPERTKEETFLLYKTTKLTYRIGPIPRSFPISWYCKLDTGMQQPNTAPWAPNATKSCKWTCCWDSVNFTESCTNLAWCSFPSKPNSELDYLNSPPSKPNKQTKILAQPSQRLILAQLTRPANCTICTRSTAENGDRCGRK